MKACRPLWAGWLFGALCALAGGRSAQATGVPISGFLPFAGISLTDEFEDDSDPTFTFYQSDYETSFVGTPLGTSGTPHYDVALIDTGAALTLLTSASDSAFNIAGAGFRGTHTLPIGGATGGLVATTNDPLAIYASGLGPSNRISTSPLRLNASMMVGQSSISLATLPAASDLPNVLGIPFASQYAMSIRNDQPQIFTLDGKTVRTPQIQFLPLGSGGQGIVRRAPITLDDPNAFLSPPAYTFDFENIFADPPVPWTEHPLYPTLRLGSSGQPAAAYFVNVNVRNEGTSLTNTPFLLDTGADVSVVSEINAVNLGFDPALDTPDFTVAVIGSGGLKEEVPGFYVDEFTIPAVGGTITLTHVPFIVLDFPNPAQVGNVAQGLIGMNVLAGRNVVIDPNPATGQGGSPPSLYISDPVTNERSWASSNSSDAWGNAANWNAGLPDSLSITNVRHVAGGNQRAVLQENRTIWELNVSGSASQTMTLEVQNGARLTTFSGINIENNGVIQITGGALDAQFVDIRGGTLMGSGWVFTGSGPIPGQVENHGGIVAPGLGIGTLNISGRFVNGPEGTLAVDLGGVAPGTQYDQIHVDGGIALEGTLAVAIAGGFTPSSGQSFEILTATDGISGTFETLMLPDDYQWEIDYGVNSVVLSIAAVGLAGDFNGDGSVDTADYVVWRKSGGNQTEYDAWRSNFGRTNSGTGASVASASAVPEPCAAILSISGFLAVAALRPLNRTRLAENSAA
ncbi:MAG TPA: retropepsin-like aspartic protease [Lacipirellulaceae bacterium]|nr:retropepsin-like aspartic protease [Lacipirellulaceae bacterium]